jgi:protein-S-isoprenylcysteine O-methyltransferase Ste14
MDDDPVLRALGEDLAREDPRLADLLATGPRPSAAHRPGPPGAGFLLLLVAAVVVSVAAPLLAGPQAIGVIGILLVLACPVVVLRWATRLPPDGSA